MTQREEQIVGAIWGKLGRQCPPWSNRSAENRPLSVRCVEIRSETGVRMPVLTGISKRLKIS
ncbi:Hypothetical protein DEACI_0877 [Acididesulfobacillus acetoxydans]|uniref:Uncharacterized protein n=1 Tax=Acididesulfobacillus acetoxydans TaxID=1561005 RepID=A0A8S0Y220_9FIRM|nr:Hypothetical protein DEACI_0877 [Acididesulfobacillus acetoxydans]CEJ09603.1 Hypothetical protein DEACI_4088 [Acididesulfobacillus acetoxydans]